MGETRQKRIRSRAQTPASGNLSWAFFKHGKFALKFDGPEGTVTIQPVQVETATSLTDQPGILVGLGKNDPKRIPPGMDAWLERSDR